MKRFRRVGRATTEGSFLAFGGLVVGMCWDAKQGKFQFESPRTLIMMLAGGALGVIHGLKS